MKTKNNLGIVMYGLCFMIVSALIISAAAVPAYPAEDDEVNIPQTDTDSWERDIESPRHFMYDDFDKFVHPRDILNAEEEEEENDGLERTFIGVTDLRADTHSIYLNLDNTVYFTVNNLGGDFGDQEYTENITASIEDIEELRDLYIGNPRVGQLDKAIEHLDEALIQVKQHQREESIKSVRQAVVHLNAASQGRHGIPTEQIIIELGEIVRLKVFSVIDEAGRNFGSEHPDVQDAEDIYDDAVDKLDDGKYIPAMNRFRKAFGTVLGAYVCDVNIHAYSWMPDGHEEDIWSGEIEQLEAESYEILSFNWHPTRRGIHYLRFNITGEYDVYMSPVETVESPYKITSFGVTVVPHEGIGIVWWKDGHVIPYGVTEVYKNAHILMSDGDLVIESGGKLIFEDEVTFIIKNDINAGDYGIHIEHGGRFVIDSPMQTTTIKTPDNDRDNTYFFQNYGTVDFTGANVMYTYGNNYLLEPGGIQNFEGSVCILDNTNVLEADTYSVYVTGDAKAYIRGEETVIGRLDGYNPDIAKGHGIWVENGVTPEIRNATIQFNQRNGIFLDQSTPSVMPVEAKELQYYASPNYDRSLIQTYNTINQPLIVAGNGNLYAVYLDEEANSIYFIRSNNKGRTWTDPIVVPGSEIGEGFVGNIDFAADGDNLALVWDVWTEIEDVLTPSLYVQYSYTGGGNENWADAPYVIGLSYYPSVDVEGDKIYVAYLYRPWPMLPITGAVMIMWTGVDWIVGPGEHEFDIEEGVPKVAVVGDTLHMVIASEGNIYYTRSDDGGIVWTELEVITGYSTKAGEDYPYGYISLKATGYSVYLVWSTYQLDNGGSYEVYGKYARYIFASEGVWAWSDDILISTENIVNSVNPDVAIDTDGNWHVVWVEDEIESTRIRYSRLLDRDDKIIVEDMVLTPDTTKAMQPTISIDSDGYAYLLWIDEIDGIYVICIKQVVGMILSNDIIFNRWNGIHISIHSDDNKILDNTIQWNHRSGILNNGNSNTISNNIVNYNQGGGIYNSRESRITISYNNLVTNNTVSWNSFYGILFFNSDDNIAYGNVIHCSDRGGIEIRDSDSNNIYDNTIYSGQLYGINVWGLGYRPKNNIIVNNYIQNAPYGIILLGDYIHLGPEDNVVTGNILINNNIGILSDKTHMNIIKNNYLDGNLVGIWVVDAYNLRLETNFLASLVAGIIFTRTEDIEVISNNISNSEHGIYLHDSSGSYIMDNEISHNIYGIYMDNSDSNIIEDNIIMQNDEGLFIEYSMNNEIINNDIHDNDGGIVFIHAWYNSITNNHIYNNDEGIYIENSLYNEILSNDIHDNDGGIVFINAYESTIADNRIFDNNKGIYLYRSSDNSLRGNNIYENQHGLHLYQSMRNTIENNEVVSNSGGIITFETYGNKIYHNQIKYNSPIQVYDAGSNQWNLPYPYGGNYWCDHTGPDHYSGPEQNILRSDGIVDDPRSIPGGNNQDQYPVTDPERFYVNVDNIVIEDIYGNVIPAENDVDYYYTIKGYAAAYDNKYGFIGYPSVSWSVENIGASASTSHTYGPSSTFNAGGTTGFAYWYADYKEIRIEIWFQIGFRM